jgi:hypothetical protein
MEVDASNHIDSTPYSNVAAQLASANQTISQLKTDATAASKRYVDIQAILKSTEEDAQAAKINVSVLEQQVHSLSTKPVGESTGEEDETVVVPSFARDMQFCELQAAYDELKAASQAEINTHKNRITELEESAAISTSVDTITSRAEEKLAALQIAYCHRESAYKKKISDISAQLDEANTTIASMGTQKTIPDGSDISCGSYDGPIETAVDVVTTGCGRCEDGVEKGGDDSNLTKVQKIQEEPIQEEPIQESSCPALQFRGHIKCNPILVSKKLSKLASHPFQKVKSYAAIEGTASGDDSFTSASIDDLTQFLKHYTSVA